MSGQVTLNNKDSGGTIRTALNAMFTELFARSIPFGTTVKISAASAATAVTILADASVPAGKKAYVQGITLTVDGSVAWADVTATKLTILSNTTELARVAKASLTANAVISTGSAALVSAAQLYRGLGGETAKGLKVIGDANFASGSDVYVTVSGVIF